MDIIRCMQNRQSAVLETLGLPRGAMNIPILHYNFKSVLF